jgi:hypothetical protein
MTLHLVNTSDSRRTIYVGQVKLYDDKPNGYAWTTSVGPGRTRYWSNNKHLAYSMSEITNHKSVPYFTSRGGDSTGTWTYTLSSGGLTCQAGMSPFTTWLAEL